MTIDRRAILLGSAAAAMSAGSGTAQPTPRFINPFDASALRTRKGRAAPATLVCEPAKAPARDLKAPPFYTDPPVFSHIDPEKLAAHNAAVAPLRALSRTVSENADRWASSQPVQGRFAACAAASLDAAAQAGSLLGEVDIQGAYSRKWTWCGLALAHLKLVQAQDYHAAAQTRVRDWLLQGFKAMRVPYDRPAGRTSSSQINNHMTWAGLTAMAIGLAAEDQAAWDWGILRMRRTLDQVDAEGFLPQELLRGAKAFHYHVFTMEPLAMGVFLARANGVDLEGGAASPFRRVAERTLSGYGDPSLFAARSGRAQESMGDRPDVGWLEIYAGAFGAAEPLALLRARRPHRKQWLGGDLTLWFARDA